MNDILKMLFIRLDLVFSVVNFLMNFSPRILNEFIYVGNDLSWCVYLNRINLREKRHGKNKLCVWTFLMRFKRGMKLRSISGCLLVVILILYTLGSLAGGVDEEMFIKSFEDVPRIQFYSAKELEEHLTNIKTVIQDPNNEWSKRSDAVSFPCIKP